ncbi:AtpZ/AtpI family protein [Chloroflexota bacterium]
MVIKRLHRAAHDMAISEGLLKLVLTMVFVPIPILIAALTGFWLDYYKLDTLPLLTIVGAVLGTFIAFMGVYRIIISRHNDKRLNK